MSKKQIFNRIIRETVKSVLKESIANENLRNYVEQKLKTFNGYETIGKEMEKLGFNVEYDGRTICNFSKDNMYFYASNHNTPFWKLDDFRVFEKQ